MSLIQRQIQADIINDFEKFEKTNKNKQAANQKSDPRNRSGSRVRNRLGINRASSKEQIDAERMNVIQEGFKRAQSQPKGVHNKTTSSPSSVKFVQGSLAAAGQGLEQTPQTPVAAGHSSKQSSEGSQYSSSMRSGLPNSKKNQKKSDSEMREQRNVKRVQLSDLNLE